MSKDAVMGAGALLGLLLCWICLSKVLAPIILLVGLFVGLPVLWVTVISKTFEDGVVRTLLMVAAFFALIIIVSIF